MVFAVLVSPQSTWWPLFSPLGSAPELLSSHGALNYDDNEDDHDEKDTSRALC